ncbi:MAG TPA: O-antigen ligase family protein [Miltoncostaeaceae bacterium]|nr:O-antigen ligase family protein [Miltoncostaeaceae bacterium]
MSAEAARDVAALACALGAGLLLVPLPRVPAAPRRLAGLALLVAGWIALALGLLPEGDAEAIGDRLTTAGGAAALLVVLVAAGAGGWLAGRLLAAHPTAWFALLGLALPLRIPVPVGGEDRYLLLPLYVVIALGVLASLSARLGSGRHERRDPRTPVDLPLGLFALVALASIAWSVDAEEGAVKAVFFWVPFLLLYVAVVDHWPRARALPALGAATVALAVPIALLAVVQYLTREIFLNERLQQANVYSRFFRANAIFYDPNILGRFLVVAIVAALALAWLRRGRARELAGLGVLVAVFCAGLAVTFSRSSCLMLITAVGLMSWWAFGARRTLAVGALVLGLMGSVAVAGSGNVRDALTSTERLERVSEGRFDLMRGGVEIWREAPLHGAGLGGFEVQYQRTLTPAEQRRIRVIISHNAPVTVLSEQGLIGLALLVWLGAAVARAGGRAARAVGGAPGWLAWTMLALAAGIVVHSLLYSALVEDPYTWVLVGGALALAARARREPAPPALPPLRTPVGTG